MRCDVRTLERCLENCCKSTLITIDENFIHVHGVDTLNAKVDWIDSDVRWDSKRNKVVHQNPAVPDSDPDTVSDSVPVSLCNNFYYYYNEELCQRVRIPYYPRSQSEFRKIPKFIFHKVTHPIVALMLFQVVFLFWHIPRFYNLALLHDVLHMVEHFTFAVVSLFLWRNIVAAYPMKSRISHPVRILYLGGVMASNIILSAFLTFSER